MTRCSGTSLFQHDIQGQQSPFSMFPECLQDAKNRASWKSSLAAIKQPISDILSFLTNTHPPAGLGDTWRPEQVVKTDHYKTSIFPKYNLCWMQCFLWKTALLRAIKRWLEMTRLALVVYANNHVKNVKVNNDSGMLRKKTNNNKRTHHLCSSTSKKFVIFSAPLLRKVFWPWSFNFLSYSIPSGG